jgi:hypothetical protein
VTIVKGESAVCAWNGSDFVKVANQNGIGNFTTVDTTNLEVTNLKALDGTAAGSIANSTGVVTLASSVLTTTDINGGTIDGTAIGGASAAAGAFTTLSATGVTTVQAGTASLPAITTSGDTNTGIFFPAADTIAFSEGGTEAMRIDASGNMGLGVTPSAWASRTVLEVGAAGNAFVSGGAGDVYVTEGCYYNAGWKYGNSLYATALYNQYRGTHSWSTAASGTAGNTVSFTQAMTLDASGNLVLGTTASASARLYVRGSGTTSATASFEASNSAGATRFYVQDDGTTRFFGSAGSETARITSAGELLVAKTSSGSTLTGFEVGTDGANTSRVSIGGANSSSATGLSLYSTTASAFRFFVSYSGQINATSTSITAISDATLKENVRDLETGLTEVMALRPRRFDWREETQLPDRNVAGFIAQEVEQVLPELVYDYKYSADATKKSLKMGDILPTLVKAIQEQQAIIQTLTDRITALEQA